MADSTIVKAVDKLVGRKIIGVRYMTEHEMEMMDWGHCSIVMTLDDGSIIFPSKDEEGNDGGAIYMQDSNQQHHQF